MERYEELQSMIDRMETRLDKALAGGSEREINDLSRDLKKMRRERDAIFEKQNACSCKV